MLSEVAGGRFRFDLHRLEDEIRRVDLTVWMRIADADDFALVLEHENAANLGARRQVAILALEGVQ